MAQTAAHTDGIRPLTRKPDLALAWAFGGSFVVVTAAHVLGLPHYVSLSLVGVVTALSARRAPLGQAVGGAVLGWLFVTGFVMNGYGELRYHGFADVERLLLLLGVAVASARWSPPRS